MRMLMRMLRMLRGRRFLFTLGLTLSLLLGLGLSAQDPLSDQVLQLLTRINTWTNTNTFYDLRLNPAIPSVTTTRIYADVAGNLYYNGVLVATSSGAIGLHNLLSTEHPDTLPAAVARGALVVGNATPAWSELTIGLTGRFLRSNGTDAAWSNDGSTLLSLSAGNITPGGILPTLNGSSLTNLNATFLAAGQIDPARFGAGSIPLGALAPSGCVGGDTIVFNGGSNLWNCFTAPVVLGTVTSVGLSMPAIFSVASSPITTAGTLAVTLATETANTVWAGPTVAPAAAPTFRALVNADLPLTGVGAGTYTKVTVNTAGLVTVGTVLTTLTTDVTGTLPMANGGTGVAVSADDTVLIGSGAAWVAQTLPNCPSPSALGYTTATNLFNCVTTGGPTHALLSATHTDSLAASVARGDVIIGNATPAWSRLAVGGAGTLFGVNGAGTDPAWSNTIARGTVVVSTPWTWTQTWNDGAVAFYGQVIGITNTASLAASSSILRLQAGAAGNTLMWAVDPNGLVTQRSGLNLNFRVTWSMTAPTISSGFGTTPSIASNNGTVGFTINVGTGGVATSGVIGLPAATTGWHVTCADVTTQSSTVYLTKQTATSTTTVTVGNYDAAGAAAAWVASDILVCSAVAY